MWIRRILRKAIPIILLFVMLGIGAVLAPDEPEDQTSSTNIYVQDNAELLSDDTKNRIFAIGQELDQKTTAQVVVVTVKTLDDKPIADYANELFRSLGIGNKEKNNGVLLLISQKPRKLRIEVGYGLEGAIPDGYTGRIRDEDLIPHLKADDYDAGVLTAYKDLAAKAAEEYGQTLDSIANDTAQPANTNKKGKSTPTWIEIVIWSWAILCFLYFWFFGKRNNDSSDSSFYDYSDSNDSSSDDSGDSFGGGDSGGGGSDGDY